jgi:hypothetical protein
MLDILVNFVSTATFRQFVIKLMERGIEINHLAPDINLAEEMIVLVLITLADALRRYGTEILSQRLEMIRPDDRFVNLLCDAGTIIMTEVMHAAFSNPSRFPLVLPLEPYTNTNWTGEQYFEFFRETINSLLNVYPTLEICRIISDNLPAQVGDLHAFLESRAENVPRVMHIPCLSHLINLIFMYVIRTDLFANVGMQLAECILLTSLALSTITMTMPKPLCRSSATR